MKPQDKKGFDSLVAGSLASGQSIQATIRTGDWKPILISTETAKHMGSIWCECERTGPVPRT